jgi:hypothetical protein
MSYQSAGIPNICSDRLFFAPFLIDTQKYLIDPLRSDHSFSEQTPYLGILALSRLDLPRPPNSLSMMTLSRFVYAVRFALFTAVPLLSTREQRNERL